MQTNASATRFLRLTTFGVRGVVGQTLTPDVVSEFASAFGTFAGCNPVAVGRDPRFSSPMLAEAVVAALMATGCDVYDCGVCPAPAIQSVIRKRDLAGGICISGGHNPMGWNALIWLGPDGTYLSDEQGETVLDIYHARAFQRVGWDRIGRRNILRGVLEDHVRDLAGFLDVEAIRKAGLTVIIDASNGSVCGGLPLFAEEAGFSLVPLNAEEHGAPPHDPEPRPRNGRQVAALMRFVDGDVGFVLNSDGSRASVIADTGETFSEEITFPLVLDPLLRRRAGPVVTNCCSSRIVDEVARRRGVPLIKTKVGQAPIIEAMLLHHGVAGGDGSGSAAAADFLPAFDGLLEIGLILENIAVSGRPVSELAKALPPYFIKKQQIPCPSQRVHRAVDLLGRHYRGQEIDRTDGVRIDWEDGWVHARASTTEPIIRVISESLEPAQTFRRLDEVSQLISQAV